MSKGHSLLELKSWDLEEIYKMHSIYSMQDDYKSAYEEWSRAEIGKQRSSKRRA